jgi:hypothetical protein
VFVDGFVGFVDGFKFGFEFEIEEDLVGLGGEDEVLLLPQYRFSRLS